MHRSYVRSLLILLVTAYVALGGCRRTAPRTVEPPATAPATQPGPAATAPATAPAARPAPPPEPPRREATPTTRAVDSPIDSPPVTIKLQQATISQILDELNRQSGVRFALVDQSGRTPAPFPQLIYDIEIDQQPLWLAVRQVGQVAGLSPIDRPYSPSSSTPQGPRDISLTVGPRQTPFAHSPASAAAHGMLFLRTIVRNNVVNLASPEEPRRTVMLDISALIDPRLSAFAARPVLEIDEAIDEHGNALKDRTRGLPMPMMMTFGGPQPWQWPLQVELELPDPSARRIARFRGRLLMNVVTSIMHLEVPDVLDVQGVSTGDHRFRVELSEVRRQGSNYELTAAITRGDLTEEQWQTLAMAYHSWVNDLQLLDADGQPLERNTPYGGGGSPLRMERRLSFRAVDQAEPRGERTPHKLVWTALPLETSRIELPFSFEDLPVP